MSTDITIAASPDAPLSFDDFVRDDVPVLARAMSIIAGDPDLTSAALTAGLQSVYDSWAGFASFDEARQHLFGAAVTHCLTPELTSGGQDDAAPHDAEPNVMLQQACAIARHVFTWNASATAVILDLDHREVVRHLGAAKQAALPGQLDDQIHEAMATAVAAAVDVDAITVRQATRRRISFAWIAVGGLAALLVLGALAQFTARPDRTDVAGPAPTQDQAATSPPAATESRATSVAESPVTDSTPIDPTLITTDGAGGFVGVRPPADGSTTALFSRSLDGQDWRAVEAWDLRESVTFSRFERSGEHFVVWIDGPGLPRGSETLGISRDLEDWRIIGSQVGDAQPVGLSYQSTISEVAVRGDTVLALVRTDVEIDFAALSTSESYTCGHSITDDSVTVNLCNSELDVLSLSGIDELPRRNRLFVSRGGPFEPASEPFSPETDVELTTIADAFVITDATGIGFASTREPSTWQTIPTGRPPFAVLAAATGDKYQVVGIGANNDGSLAVFRTVGATTRATPLAEIIGETSGDVDARIAAGPTRWVIYVFEQDTTGQGTAAQNPRAWVLSSPDGLTWAAVPATPPSGGDEPRLLPGDDQVLVQWTDTDGELVTLSVPLPL